MDVGFGYGGSGGGSGGGSSDIAFATAIPLTSGGNAYMPPHTVSAPLAFTLAANPTKNSIVYVPIIADGTNIPTFSSSFKQWGTSEDYNNTVGIENQLQLFYDGRRAYYSWTQVVGAVAQATAVAMTGPTSGVISTASTNFTVSITGDITGTVRCTPSDSGHGGTFTPAFLDLLNGTTSGTFTYTPNSTVQTDVISLTNNGSLSNPSSINYSALAAPSVPGAPTIGTATATGATTGTVAFTAPGSNGGATITSYTATGSVDGVVGTLSQAGSGTINLTGLTTGTPQTFTVHAHNSVGNSSESASSNSITPSASTQQLRLSGLIGMVESGSGPYTYTGDSSGHFNGSPNGGIANKHLPASTDGWAQCTLTVGNEMTWGLSTQSAVTNYINTEYFVHAGTLGSNYEKGSGSSIGASDVTTVIAANDIIRMNRTGTTVTAQISKDGGSTFTVFNTWTGATSAALYPQGGIINTAAFTAPTGSASLA